jgi:hypothetical protein
MAKKEWCIEHGRLGEERKREWRHLLGGLRRCVGKAFLKKAVFAQRSEELVRGIGESLMPASAEYLKLVVASEGSHLMEVNDGEGMVQIHVEVEVLMASLATLKEDLLIQATLDAALRGGIVSPCQDARFSTCRSERVDMARFVVFVDKRLSLLEEGYARIGKVVGGIEELIGGLKVDQDGELEMISTTETADSKALVGY